MTPSASHRYRSHGRGKLLITPSSIVFYPSGRRNPQAHGSRRFGGHRAQRRHDDSTDAAAVVEHVLAPTRQDVARARLSVAVRAAQTPTGAAAIRGYRAREKVLAGAASSSRRARGSQRALTASTSGASQRTAMAPRKVRGSATARRCGAHTANPRTTADPPDRAPASASGVRAQRVLRSRCDLGGQVTASGDELPTVAEIADILKPQRADRPQLDLIPSSRIRSSRTRLRSAVDSGDLCRPCGA
jgi:hypothetical protein